MKVIDRGQSAAHATELRGLEMTETIAPEVQVTDVTGEVDIQIEDDATPLVRLIGRTLRDSVRAGQANSVLRHLNAVVALRSHDTPQAATISFARGTIRVSSGVFIETDATITVDLNARFAPAGEQAGADDIVSAVLLALSPPLPDWREAAASFWNATCSMRGMPDVLIAVAAHPNGDIEPLVLGEGDTQYLIAGPPDSLVGIFTGANDLIATLYSGVVGIRGTISQLSVMTGASWKVRYDV